MTNQEAIKILNASDYFWLRPSKDEFAAIRWHMGEYNVADNEMNELHECNHSYPLCYMIQFADRLACTEY